MTFDIGLHETCVRAGVRYVITKFSQMDSLPNFLTHGAPLCARFARARSSARNCRFRSYLVFRTKSQHFCPKKASLWVVRKEISNHREPTLLFVNCKWKLNNRLNLTCFVLFLNLLRCEVKWKLFYDAKTMFKSTPRLLLISQCNMWFN